MRSARSSSHSVLNIVASTGVLLISAAVIFSHADDLSMWFDEIWSVFLNRHTLSQIIKEHDLNWPPGYAVTLYGWTRLIGSENDFVIHMFGALIGLLSVAFTILAARALANQRAGWLAGLAFGTSGYAIYFLLEARGYGLVLLLGAALIAFHARWTEKPTWARAIPYTLVQIMALYTHYTTGLVIALTAVRIALVVPRRYWWRWIVIMAITGLVFLPLLPRFIDSYQLRSEAFSEDSELASYFLKGPEALFHAYSSHADIWWGLVIALAGIGLFIWATARVTRREHAATVLWLALWGFGIPIYAYLTRSSQGMFTTRYLSYTLPAIMTLVGIGLAALPRRSWLAGGLLLLYAVTVPWQPFDHRPKYSDSPPVRDLVREMAKRFETGDTLVIDPHIKSDGFAWTYYEALYFQGRTIPRATDGYTAGPRVWHLVRQGSVDAEVEQSVQTGRIATEFWGPWYFIATLYEGPLLSPGYTLGDTLTYRGASLPDGNKYLPSDTFHVETWWSVEEVPAYDYSLSVKLVDANGQTITQADGGPMGPYTPGQTSAWQPGEVYRDDRTLTIPHCQATGDYDVVLVVYQWWDGAQLAPAGDAPHGPYDSIVLDTISIDSFAYCDR